MILKRSLVSFWAALSPPPIASMPSTTNIRTTQRLFASDSKDRLKPTVPEQEIIGYHLDEEDHWVAELECEHNQHVRHDPPLVDSDGARTYVLSRLSSTMP